MKPANNTIMKSSCLLLGAFLLTAGVSHLTFLRKDFQAQVPDWILLPVDDTVVYSGVAEMALGASLIVAGKNKNIVGKVAAAFFTVLLPGNIEQYKHHRSAFGLNTDSKRLARLFFQPVLIYWALKSTEE